jgi:hypothetical protein
MESKIEEIMKLGFVKILGEEVADKETILELAEKLSQVIDHLNSQEQGEEKIEIPEAYRKAFLDEDTPEEWEKEFKFLYGHLYIQNEDGEFCKISGETEDMIDFIKQLLEDREDFTREDLKVIKMSLDGMTANEICTVLDGESFDNTLEKVVSKLNNKKK